MRKQTIPNENPRTCEKKPGTCFGSETFSRKRLKAHVKILLVRSIVRLSATFGPPSRRPATELGVS